MYVWEKEKWNWAVSLAQYTVRQFTPPMWRQIYQSCSPNTNWKTRQECVVSLQIKQLGAQNHSQVAICIL